MCGTSGVLMDVLPAGGTLLRAPSVAERARSHGLITGATMADEAARVQCVAGRAVTNSFSAGRARTALLLSGAAGPLARPAVGEPPTCPEAPTPEQLRRELLDHLDSCPPHFSHAGPHLRPAGVRREGLVARIRVTSGSRELAYEVPLDGRQMPAAVTGDVSAVFPSRPRATS